MKTETASDALPVFPDCKNATHMPFTDGKTLLFSQSGAPIERQFVSQGSIWKTLRHNPALAERFKNLPRTQKVRYRPWKLAHCDLNDKVIHPIKTGLQENGIECSPTFYSEGSRVHLSFIGGADSKVGLTYMLYACSGDDLGHLGAAKPVFDRAVFFGFVSPSHICWGHGNELNLQEKASKKTFRFNSGFARIVRVAFLAEDSTKLLVTGINQARGFQTVLHNLGDGTTSDVSSDGAAVYKSSLYGGSVIFARKDGAEFESRTLFQSAYSLSPSIVPFTKRD
jgi:hypothetical protein